MISKSSKFLNLGFAKSVFHYFSKVVVVNQLTDIIT